MPREEEFMINTVIPDLRNTMLQMIYLILAEETLSSLAEGAGDGPAIGASAQLIMIVRTMPGFILLTLLPMKHCRGTERMIRAKDTVE